jgi:quinol monooxygenase YgiN
MRRNVLSLAVAALAIVQSGCSAQKAASPAAPSGDPAKNVYVVTHIDVTPNFSDGAKRAIQKYAADSRQDPGAIRIEGMVQDGRSNHFIISEVWESREAFEAHTALQHSRDFRETLHPMLGSPFDERLHSVLP